MGWSGHCFCAPYSPTTVRDHRRNLGHREKSQHVVFLERHQMCMISTRVWRKGSPSFSPAFTLDRSVTRTDFFRVTFYEDDKFSFLLRSLNIR
jgi:hypothetical protein